MLNTRFLTLSGMIFLAALSRLVPHPWNVTPVAAMALFAGARFDQKKMAFLIPLVSLFLSDLVLGFHRTMPFVYGSFVLTVLMGLQLKKNSSHGRIVLGCLVSSVLFFLITNAGYWVFTRTFDKTIPGLMQCYSVAVPFFRNSLFGDIFYTALLFGSFAWMEKRLPSLQPAVYR